MKKSHRFLLATCFLTLFTGTALNVLAQKAYVFSEDKIPRFNIPETSKPPVIDGTIGKEEWKDSVKIMGMSQAFYNKYHPRPHAFYVAWDKEHLYIAGRAHILPGHKLLKSRREKRAMGVVHDDSFEFGIDMLGRNKLPGEVQSYFKFVLNSLNSGEYMKNYPEIGQMLYNWRPDLDMKSKLHQTKDGTFWEIEFAMDLQDLQMPVENQPGDVILMLFSADLKNPGWDWGHFASASVYLRSDGFPKGTLTQLKPYIQIDKLDGFEQEKIDLKSTIYNPSEKPVKVKVDLLIANEQEIPKTINSKVTKAIVKEEKILTIPAKGSVKFDVSESFAGKLNYDTKNRQKKMRGVFDFNVSLAENKNAASIFSSNIWFRPEEVKKYLKKCADYKPSDKSFLTFTQFNPVKNMLLVEADTLDAKLPKDVKVEAVQYELTKDGKTICKGTIKTFANYKFQDLIKMPELTPGTYKLTLKMVDKSGKELAIRDDITFEKKDEAKLFAKWWNTNIGNVERVIPPFEALNVSQDIFGNGTSISCTLRKYQLDGLGLPVQIDSATGKVLTKPARIVVTIDDVEHVVPTDSQLKITDSKDWRVTFKGNSEAAGLKFSTDGWMEQDGLVNLNLTYEPIDKPVTIQELRVEWPLDDSRQNYMTVIGHGGNYCSRYIDIVPNGQGEIWSSLKNVGLTGANMTKGNFYSNIWIGNDLHGLLWCGESDEGWVPNDKISSHTILREGNTLSLRNHLIGTYPGDKPYVLKKAKTANLQYNASPFKKLEPGWRINMRSACNGFSEKPKYKVNWDTGKTYFTVLSPPFKDTKRWDEYYKYCKEVTEKRKLKGLYDQSCRLKPYFTNQIAVRGYGPKSLEEGVYPYFKGAWLSASNGETLCKSYTDYMIYLMNRQVSEGGANHFYFDISFVNSMKGLAAGMGYRLPDGRIQPTGANDNLRKWYMRVSAMMDENGVRAGGVSGHATNAICLKALPWASAILDSEFPMKDPITVYKKDRMIALSNPHNFGVNINHLGFMNPEWASMFDSGMGGDHGSVFDRPAFRNWGISEPDVEFTGCWQNQKIVRRIADGLLASIWQRPGSAVIEVMNYGLDPQGSEKKRACVMTLDLGALGVPESAIKAGNVRIQNLFKNQKQKYSKKMTIFKWYKDMPGEGQEKYKPAINPELNLKTGAITGFDINYHAARFIVINWNENPIEKSKLTGLTSAEQTEALNWGINSQNAKQVTPGSNLIQTTPADIKTMAWQRPNSVMIKVSNSGKEKARVKIKLDLEKLGIKVQKLWVNYTQIFAPDGKPVKNTILANSSEAFNNQLLGKGTALYDASIGEVELILQPGENRMFCLDTY
jgi:hypothetical protein